MSERWPETPDVAEPPEDEDPAVDADADADAAVEAEDVVEDEAEDVVEDEAEDVIEDVVEEQEAPAAAAEHTEGGFSVPDGYGVLQGKPEGSRTCTRSSIVSTRLRVPINSPAIIDGALFVNCAAITTRLSLIVTSPSTANWGIGAVSICSTTRLIVSPVRPNGLSHASSVWNDNRVWFSTIEVSTENLGNLSSKMVTSAMQANAASNGFGLNDRAKPRNVMTPGMIAISS